ncbi:MAG TPA: hypothetical protein VGM58_03795 [Verrucomicrobiae bacterium]|jgi:hypothetical protein
MQQVLEKFRLTHKFCDLLSQNGIIVVHFADGRDFELSGCGPVDSSIYNDTGRWCCTVERYLGKDEKSKKLFTPNSGVDIMEKDIIQIIDKATGKVLYSKI